MALASATTFSWPVVRTPSGGEGLPKVCCRRTSRFGHLCSQCSCVCGSSLHNGHVGSAAGPSRWAYALKSDVCPARRRARRTASVLLEVAMQSALSGDVVVHHGCSGPVGRVVGDGASDGHLYLKILEFAYYRGIYNTFDAYLLHK